MDKIYDRIVLKYVLDKIIERQKSYALISKFLCRSHTDPRPFIILPKGFQTQIIQVKNAHVFVVHFEKPILAAMLGRVCSAGLNELGVFFGTFVSFE